MSRLPGPAKGQSEQQLSADRYDCPRWAVTETGLRPIDLGETTATAVRYRCRITKPPAATGKGASRALAGAVLGHGERQVETPLAVQRWCRSGRRRPKERRNEGAGPGFARGAAGGADEMKRTKAENAMRRANYRAR